MENSARDIVADLDLLPKNIQREESIELWHRLSVLILILFMLSLEWFIRKRKGLASNSQIYYKFKPTVNRITAIPVSCEMASVSPGEVIDPSSSGSPILK